METTRLLGRALAVSAVLALGAALPASAATSLAVANADFEGNGVTPDGYYGGSHEGRGPAGWSASGGSGTGLWNPTAASFASEAGYGSVGWASNALQTSGSASVLGQVLAGYAIQANTLYTLTLDVGRHAGLTGEGWSYDFGLLSGFGTNSSSILARATSNLSADGKVIGAGEFGKVTLQFQTGAAGPEIGKSLFIGLGAMPAGFGYGAAYDNLKLEASSLAAAVPEPGTWAMMILGFFGAGSALRSRRRSLALA